MYFRELSDCLFFGGQVFNYAEHGKARFYVAHDFEVTFGREQFIDYIEHCDGDAHIRIHYRDGTFLDASLQEDLHMGVFKLVHIVNL